MRAHQLELNFVSPSKKAAVVKDATPDNCCCVSEYYRINRYIDWWCDRVPRCLGWGAVDRYESVRLWAKSSYQKVRYGVSNEECWNLNSTLTKYILPRLKHYRRMDRCGIPNSMYLKCHPMNGDSYDDVVIKEWNDILDELIWTFEYIDDPEKINPIPDIPAANHQNNGDYLGWLHREKTQEEKLAWQQYIERCDDLENRKRKGLLLFAEHFDSLWD